jgi:hypothetical protein
MLTNHTRTFEDTTTQCEERAVVDARLSMRSIVGLVAAALVASISACGNAPDSDGAKGSTAPLEKGDAAVGKEGCESSSGESSGDSAADEDSEPDETENSASSGEVEIADCTETTTKGECNTCCYGAYPDLREKQDAIANKFDECTCKACQSECADDFACGGDGDGNQDGDSDPDNDTKCVECRGGDKAGGCLAAQDKALTALKSDPEYAARKQCRQNSKCDSKPAK